jgi:hypothetical protein
MERIMTNQVFTNVDNLGYMKSRKTFEINPNHPVIQELLAKVKNFEGAKGDEEKSDESDEEKAVKDSAVLLYQTCLLNSGFSLPADSSSEFGHRLERLIRSGLGVPLDASVQEVEVDLAESTEEEAKPSAVYADEEEIVLDAGEAHVHEEL